MPILLRITVFFIEFRRLAAYELPALRSVRDLRACDAARLCAPVEKGPCGKPYFEARVLGLPRECASIFGPVSSCLLALCDRRVRRFFWFSRLLCPELGVGAAHRSVWLCLSRSRSPVGESARRACRAGRAQSPRVRIRPQRLWVTCLHANPFTPVERLFSLAYGSFPGVLYYRCHLFAKRCRKETVLAFLTPNR